MLTSHFYRLVIGIAGLGAALAHAEIRYSVHPAENKTKLEVTVKFRAKSGPLEVQMPNWSPGDYSLNNFGKEVKDFQWRDGSGHPIQFSHPSFNSWKTVLPSSGETTVQYTVPCRLEGGALHYGGTSTYVYIPNRKDEACRLDLNIPKGWKVAVGLDSVGQSITDYTAKTYDVLADNPVTMGVFTEYAYASHGRPVTIAIRGTDRNKVSKDKIVKLCQKISDCEGDFFRGVPYRKYVWHFTASPIKDGGAGLEHLSSTEVVLADSVGPVAARVCAHEFFHLWNVKRVRSKVLGPFDYTQLPKTGAIYWLEGVTDYYASLLLTRSGYLGEDALRSDLANNLTSVRTNPARLEVSAYECSLRESETSNGQGNGSGWRMDYYSLGWMVGLCLDLDLRARTHGKKSLDDLERALFKLCKNDQPGFEEGEIERQYVKLGGSKDYFEKVVMKPGELPVDDALAKVGLKIQENHVHFVDRGFGTSGVFGSPTLLADSVKPFVASAGLAEGDTLLEINGKSIVGKTLEDSISKLGVALDRVKAGDAVKLKVRRKDTEKEIAYTAMDGTNLSIKVVAFSEKDPKKLSFRKAWITGTVGRQAGSVSGTY